MGAKSFDYESLLAGKHDLRLSAWGPYTKRYMGISHVPEPHAGLRFDLGVFPGLYRRTVNVPNVTWETDFHPWESAPDLSYYSVRHEIVWKDEVFVDVAYCRIDEGAVLIRARCLNQSSAPQTLTLNYAASLHFPPHRTNSHESIRLYRVILPAGGIWIDALDYDSVHYARFDPRADLVWDGHLRGEVRDHGFVDGVGLGDGFGASSDDVVIYTFTLPDALNDARIVVRCRVPSDERAELRFFGAVQGTLDIFGRRGFGEYTLDAGSLAVGVHKVKIQIEGGVAVELDGIAVLSGDGDDVRFTPVTWNPVPKRSAGPHDNALLLEYAHVEGAYGLAWSAESAEVREFFCDDLDTTMRYNVHHHVHDVFHGVGDGHYTNVFMRPIFLDAGAEHVIYGLVCTGTADSVRERLATFNPVQTDIWDTIYEKQHADAVDLRANPAGEPYRFSQERMAAVVLTNLVYPVRTRGTYIRHNTPGRWWDSLYTWDSGFVGLGLLELDIDRAIDCLNAYVTEPGEAGAAFIHHGSMVPVQFYLFAELCNRTDDALLAYFYPRMVGYYRFMLGRLGSSTTRTLRSGLIRTWDYFYNSGGWDDYPAQKYVHANGLAASVTPVVNTAHMIRAARIMGRAANALGADAGEYLEDIAALTDSLNEYAWDEESGYFGYVTHDGDGKPAGILRHENGANFNMGLDGASPLVAGICTPEQEARLIAHLFDPARLWTPHGITAVDQSAPYYRADGYWNGAVWMAHQWFLWKALLDMGAADEAHQIAATALDLWRREVEQTYHCFEHFIVATGRGAGWHQFGGLSSPVLMWYGAYHRPGRLTAGLDAYVQSVTVDVSARSLVAQIRFDSPRRQSPIIIVVLAPFDAYRVTINGEPVEYFLRYPGTLEITCPVGEALAVELHVKAIHG